MWRRLHQIAAGAPGCRARYPGDQALAPAGGAWQGDLVQFRAIGVPDP